MEFSNDISLIIYIAFFAITAALANSVENSFVCSNSTSAIKLNKGVIEYNATTLFREFVFLLIPCLFLGLRYGIGTDYFSYEQSVEEAVKSSAFDFSRNGGFSTEIGNYILTRISMSVFHNYHGYLFAAALVTFGCFWKFFKEYVGVCKYYLMTFICLASFLGPAMNIMRQIMAVAIVSLSLRYVFDRKPIKYILTILIATCFHTSAIMFLPIYFLYTKKHTFFRSLLRWCLCLAIPLLYGLFSDTIVNLPIFAKYAMYDADTVNNTATYVYVIAKAPLFLLILLSYKKLISLDKRNEFLIYLFLIEIVASLLGGYMHWAFRFMYYGMVAEIVLIPQMISILDQKGQKIAPILIIIYYGFYFLSFHYLGGNDGIFPLTFSLIG